MRRRGVGGNSRASGAAGFFGTMLGIGPREGQQQNQQNQPVQRDVITPKSGGKVVPTNKAVSIGISPYGEVVTVPLFERHW